VNYSCSQESERARAGARAHTHLVQLCKPMQHAVDGGAERGLVVWHRVAVPQASAREADEVGVCVCVHAPVKPAPEERMRKQVYWREST
jgi:hypothetical protein